MPVNVEKKQNLINSQLIDVVGPTKFTKSFFIFFGRDVVIGYSTSHRASHKFT